MSANWCLHTLVLKCILVLIDGLVLIGCFSISTQQIHKLHLFGRFLIQFFIRFWRKSYSFCGQTLFCVSMCACVHGLVTYSCSCW